MKTLAAITCFLILATVSQAQISIAAHAGYTLAWEDYGDIILPEDAVIHIHGFHAAAAINYTLSKRISLATEPGLTRRGAACVPGWNQGINPNPNFPADTRFLLDYAELPMLFQMHFGFGQGRFELVPSLGYSTAMMLRGTEETIDLETKKVVNSRLLDIGGAFGEVRRFDHGAKCGLKLARNFVGYQVYAKTSFYMAMRDASPGLSSKNRALDLSIGYMF